MALAISHMATSNLWAVARGPHTMFLFPHMTFWWNIEELYCGPLVDRPFPSLHFLFPLLLLSCCRGVTSARVVCRSGRQTTSGAMTGLIYRSCRMKRPLGVNPFQGPQWKLLSDALPFAALTVLKYDEKGPGRVRKLSSVYEKRNNEEQRRGAEDGEM